MDIPYFDGEERDPRLEVELLTLSPHLPESGHYLDGLHFDERGLVLVFRDGDNLHPRTYEMQLVFSGAFDGLRVTPLDVFQDNKLMLLSEKAGVSRPKFWAFSCRHTNYFNWCLRQSLNGEGLEAHGRHYVLAATDQLVEVFSVQPPRVFFTGFGMDLPETEEHSYPSGNILYDLP